MKPIYLIIALLLALLPVGASGNNQQQQNKQENQQQSKKKEHTVKIYGNVKDSFTQLGLKAFVTVMNQDSTVVDTITTSGWEHDLYYEINVPARPATYIIKAECDGYETKCLNHTIKYIARNKSFEMPSLFLKKKANKEVMLDDVVVTSTKVKFAYRGDTLVYNASAFNVPDGSMLDVLIRQMPGAEIKSNGDIYVNGKKIDYLLLNGKDFFKGKNQVMLDNLPYYTVKELKVYDRSSDKSRLMGKEMEQKDYVMDVGLKREYNRGYIANMEAAGGTKDRYLGRLFGLYYTDRIRLSIFGNLNNVNETRRPGREGDWSPANSPQGQKITRKVGIDFSTSSKNDKFNEVGNITFGWDNTHDMSRNSTESFASAGNIFSRRISDTRTSRRNFNLYNTVSLQGETGLFFNTTIDYNDNKSLSLSRSATYSAEPNRWGDINSTIDSTFAENVQGTLRDIITNRSLNRSRSEVSMLNVSNDLMTWHKLAWGDRIEMYINGTYSNSKPNESFSLSRNDYFKTGDKDLRNYYNDRKSNSYSLNASLSYGLEIPYTKWTVLAGPTFSQNYISTTEMNYRLDQLGGEWMANPEMMYATLPSNMQLLEDVVDNNTSRRYNTLKRNSGGELRFQRNTDDSYFQISLKLVDEDERINYHSMALDTTATRSRLVFRPSMFYSKFSSKLNLYFNYYVRSSFPDFLSIMPYTDNSDPLSVTVNNPNLKNSLFHHYDFNLRLSGLKNQQYVGFFITGNFYHNNVSTRTRYNTQTGGYTYMSDNIGGGGNWDFWSTISYGTALGKARLFRLDYKLWVNGLRRKEFDIAYDDDPMQICYTFNSELGNSLYLHFQKEKLSISLGGKVEWKHSVSDRSNFDKINAYQFDYGGNLTYTLPLGITLSTDIKEYCRRGYSVKSFNTSDLVWNASLARSFCKGKLTFTAEAFDILQNLSSTQYNVSGQSRSETWLNSLPSYAMMKVAYKFSKSPKSKK